MSLVVERGRPDFDGQGGLMPARARRERVSSSVLPRAYLRDGRAPIPATTATSRVMSANRGKDTGPELAFRRALREAGLKGYRTHPRQVPGRPDVVFVQQRVAVFVHGCFWHRCPACRFPLPKSHREYWVAKFRRNRLRDRRKMSELVNRGWTPLVMWEHGIQASPRACVARVRRLLRTGESTSPTPGRS